MSIMTVLRLKGTLKVQNPMGKKNFQCLLVPASGSLQPPGFIRGFHSVPDRVAPQLAQPEPGTQGAGIWPLLPRQQAVGRFHHHCLLKQQRGATATAAAGTQGKRSRALPPQPLCLLPHTRRRFGQSPASKDSRSHPALSRLYLASAFALAFLFLLPLPRARVLPPPPSSHFSNQQRSTVSKG